MVTTSPPSSASTAAWYPEPVPTSSTLCPGRTSSASQMRATMYGCEIVWPSPMGRAASSKARRRSGSGTKSSRGTRPIARSTSSSTMSRARSWRATMSARSSSGRGMRGAPDAEVAEHQRSDVDDPPRNLVAAPDDQDRNLGVAELERAMAAAAEVAPAREVGELHTGRRRDDQLAGVRVGGGTPGSFERIGLVEQRLVAARLPPPCGRAEPKLLPVAARDRLVALAVEDDVRGIAAVQPPSQGGGVVAVDHPGPVGSGDDHVVQPGKALLQGGHAVDAGLPMVGADDHGVALEKLVRPARGLDQRADRRVAACKRLLRLGRPERGEAEFVAGQVVKEKAEAGARPEPAADRGRVGVDRAGG